MVVEDTCSTTIPDYMSQIGTSYFVMYILLFSQNEHAKNLLEKSALSKTLFFFSGAPYNPYAPLPY